MCVGVPMEVLSAGAYHAVCRGRTGTTRVDTLITGPLAVGQWVLCFLGAAREVIDSERAHLVDAALDALDAIAAGQGDLGDQCDLTALMNSHFADLIGREPQLPEFLRVPAVTEFPT
jgi:hydrogenase expression/formation protein HypC